jgi:DNA-binding LytR/AlgR family response regulator
MTEMLRVVIVDDEEPARMAVRQDLEEIGGVQIVAECANGFEAIKAVGDLRPDVLLLDVQMPKLDGFEVLEVIGRDVAVIFMTAYDEYALKAFEVHAVDYLLKPCNPERLREAVSRARSRRQAWRPQPCGNRPGSPGRRSIASSCVMAPMCTSCRWPRSTTWKRRTTMWRFTPADGVCSKNRR